MFFAQNLILVEGIAEQLVIPEFASSMGYNLADSHTSIINIGGRYFNHFLKLFDTQRSEFALIKKVACITDLDPVRKNVNSTDWKKCLPILLNAQSEVYEYKQTSNLLIEEYINNDEDSFIQLFTQDKGKSSTFEYELVLKNPTCEQLVTPSVSNATEIKDLMKLLKENDPLEKFVTRLGKNKFKDEISNLITLELLEDSLNVKQNIIASRYLLSISKGEAAQELAYVINTNDKGLIKPPDYISEAISWICR